MKNAIFYFGVALIAAVILVGIWSAPGITRRIAVQKQLESIATAARNYQIEYGTFPSLPKSAFYSALTGANPRSIVFLAPPVKRMTSPGIVLDPWGSEYGIRPAPAAGTITITSPGPDRVSGTADDSSVTR